MTARAAGRQAAVQVVTMVVLLAIYGATLARDVTFWDAGEFIASAATFGIPHPPGTPLYVMLLRSAMLVLGAVGVPPAVATSLVSAAFTAGACAAGAALLHRASRDRLAAIAGGITAGTMATVWLNATETEVYAASLALSLAVLWAAERAGRRGSFRWTVATAYLAMLAVPLHLSALLVAPAAIYLAAGGARWPSDRASASRAGIVAAACIMAFALGRMTPGAVAVALVALGAATWAAVRYPLDAGVPLLREPRALPPLALRGLLPMLAAVVAASALLVLYARAQHDPAVNQGNPASLAALVDLVARRQYDVAALWPRQAPLWLQVGNLGLYADWQVARSLGATIFPTPMRTGMTLVFVALGISGAMAHWRRDRRSATAFGLLLLAGTVGAALYLNLKAGPSFGHGILADGAVREARERDYFFVVGWWAWGAWAGFGAVVLARRAGAPGGLGLAAALLPAALNWTAVDRTRQPEAGLARATAEGLLGWLPPRAVLFVAGDNDTYPLWYAQQALGMRRDVTVVTLPLLPADWYRAELARRDGLLDVRGRAPWRGRAAAVNEVAGRARLAGRPLAMSVAVPARERLAVGTAWTLRGAAYVEAGAGATAIDTVAAALWRDRLAALTAGRPARPAIDGTARYMEALLRCPGLALEHIDEGALAPPPASLAPHCNFR